MEVGKYYELITGVQFKLQAIRDGVCICRKVNKKDTFQLTIKDVTNMLNDGSLVEIEAPEVDLTIGARIRGGEIQDRTIT